jgi:hypothetical protein
MERRGVAVNREEFLNRWQASIPVFSQWSELAGRTFKKDLDDLISDEQTKALENAKDGWRELSNDYINLKKDFDDVLGFAEGFLSEWGRSDREGCLCPACKFREWKSKRAMKEATDGNK